jgi:hypothetical protein
VKIEVPTKLMEIQQLPPPMAEFFGAMITGTATVDGVEVQYQVIVSPPGVPDGRVSALMPGRSLMCRKTKPPKTHSEATLRRVTRAAVKEMAEFEAKAFGGALFNARKVKTEP